MPEADGKDKGEDSVDVLCPHCGHALYEFLHEMEEHNAEVVCPSCGKKPEGNPPASAPPREDQKRRRPQAPTPPRQTGKSKAH